MTKLLTLLILGLTLTQPVYGLVVNGEMKGAQLENLASDPAGKSGRVYFDSTTKKPKFYNGTAWSEIGASNWTVTGSDIYRSSKVGIGTTAPAASLHVVGTSGTTVKIVDGNQGAGKVLVSDANGVASWGAAASGSSGINYITNYTAEVDTTGWSTYADAAGASPVDGTGGSPTVTWTRSTSSPLRGTGSFLFTKDAANRQGQGTGYAFTIDSADQGHVVNVSFDYRVASGTYADGDLTIWIYDVTNAVLIQPAPYKILNASGPIHWTGSFQAASNSTSYRLITHVASTSTSAYTVKFDNFLTGPNIQNVGTPVTDWVSFTPAAITGTGGGSLNIGTGGGATYTAEQRRVGDSIEINYVVRVGSSGASDVTGTYIFPFPSGISTSIAGFSSIGYGDITVVGTGSPAARLVAKTYGAGFVLDSTDTGLLSAGGALWTNANFLTVRVSFKVTGWSSGTVMSSDAGNSGVVVARAYRSTALTITNVAQAITFNVTSYDTVGGFSGGAYTVKVPGYYRIKPKITVDVPTSVLFLQTTIYKGATLLDNTFTLVGNTAYSSFTSETTAWFNAGESITVYANVGANTGGLVTGELTNIEIERISTGNQQIAASDNVAFIANSQTPTGTLGAALNIVKFGTVTKDSHGAYNTTTGVYTVPVSGWYYMSGTIEIDHASITASQAIAAGIYKNGTAQGGFNLIRAGAVGNTDLIVTSSHLVYCNAGDTLDIRSFTTGTTPVYATTFVGSSLQIHRTGL